MYQSRHTGFTADLHKPLQLSGNTNVLIDQMKFSLSY